MSSAARYLTCKSLEAADKSLGKPAVILTTGSYNPPHVGHVNLLSSARDKLQDQGYNVIVCLISPSHDDYVNRKLRQLAIPGWIRLKMLQLTIQDLDNRNILADSWEIDQPLFVDHPEVIRQLQKELRLIRDDVSVWYACGSDLYNCCCRGDGHGAEGLIVANRQDVKRSGFPHISIDNDIINSSSTQIREAGTDLNELSKHMTPSSIECYLCYLSEQQPLKA